MAAINVVVPFWNAGEWIMRSLESLADQSRAADRVVVIDDASNDPPVEPPWSDRADQFCRAHGWEFTRNEANVGKALNLRRGIASMSLAPEDVVVVLDGDDFLCPDALERIEHAYEDPNVWVTYGQYEPWPANSGQVLASAYPEEVLRNRSFRTCRIHFNHPLTFRHYLWEQLEDRDLQDDSGNWFVGGADFVLMIPLLEMAGPEHLLFIEDVIYRYNAVNPLADNLVNDGSRQGQIVRRPQRSLLDWTVPAPVALGTTEPSQDGSGAAGAGAVYIGHGHTLTAVERIQVIRAYARISGLRTFVETGTANGDTPAALVGEFDRLVTVEIDPDVAERSRQRFADDPRVEVVTGDSAAFLAARCTSLGPALYWLDGHFCLDAETEILTRRGWLDYRSVVLGDETLSIDLATGRSFWRPITELSVLEVAGGSMVSLEGKSFSALATANHSWLTSRREGDAALRFVPTVDLHGVHRIPLSAPRGDSPVETPWDDAFVELVGWWVTEGSVHRNGGVTIGQSLAANPGKVARIDWCLRKLYGPPGNVRRGEARWSRKDAEWNRKGHGPYPIAVFRLPRPIEYQLTAVAPNRVASPEWLCSLTWEQLDIFIETCVLGDGTCGDKVSYTQADEARIRAFEVACALAGRATSTSYEAGTRQWHTTLRTGRVGPARWTGLRGMKVAAVPYDGIAWCPTVPPDANWLARRRGSVYFTGNCGGAKGPKECPLLDELAAIAAAGEHNVVLIDDARLLGTLPDPPHTERWPTLDEVIEALPGYRWALEDDIVRATWEGE